ncbi:uncharacterized protein A4U43_C02F12590 [Asparagus officinalis]|uniref:Uncharacterized protein n=1 Tax=Asparagus officinalis TaxID=4686 RepID=A0A5P1FI04_ASPOF|nr:uncharacterized protein A4U43_C02F12590 [Asparagus officinalis]
MNIDKSNDHAKATKDKSVNGKNVESSSFLVNNHTCGINVEVSDQTAPNMMNIEQNPMRPTVVTNNEFSEYCSDLHANSKYDQRSIDQAQSKPDPLQNYEVQAHAKQISENYDTSATGPMASTTDITDTDVTVDISVSNIDISPPSGVILGVQGSVAQAQSKLVADTLPSYSDSHVIITPTANKPADKEVSIAVASVPNIPQTDTAYTMDIVQVEVGGSIGYNSDCIHKNDRGSPMPCSGGSYAGTSILPGVETPKTLLHQFTSDQPVQVQVSEQGEIQPKVNITNSADTVDISYPPTPISVPNPEWDKEISQYKQTKPSQKNSTGMEMSSSDSLRRSVRLKGTSNSH